MSLYQSAEIAVSENNQYQMEAIFLEAVNSVRNNEIETIQYLIDNGVDVNTTGGGALIGAIINKNLPLMKLLVDSGADINMDNGYIFEVAEKLHRKEILDYLNSLKNKDIKKYNKKYNKQKVKNISENYFNIISKELDVNSNNDYRLVMRDENYNNITIINELDGSVHYSETTNDDTIIYGGQGEYIINDINISLYDYLECMKIIDQINPIANNSITKITEDIVNQVKFHISSYKIFFVPKVLYNLYFIRQHILSPINIIPNDNIEEQMNSYSLMLNRIIVEDFDITNLNYGYLYQKLVQCFGEIVNLPINIGMTIGKDGTIFIKNTDFDLILKSFKLECSYLSKLGYILYRGSNFDNDVVYKNGIIYSLSYGISLFAGLRYDVEAMAFYYMTSNQGYCIIVPFNQMNACLFYVPPLTLVEPLLTMGETFHARTRSLHGFSHQKILTVLKTPYNKYNNLILVDMLCSPEDVEYEFNQYKKTAIILK